MDSIQFINSLDLNATSDFNTTLGVLGGILNDTATDSVLRRNFLEQSKLKILSLIVPDIRRDDMEYVRLLRGCVLLLRNLAVEDAKIPEDVIVQSLESCRAFSGELGHKLVLSYYEVLANMSQHQNLNVSLIRSIRSYNIPYSIVLENVLDHTTISELLHDANSGPFLEFLFGVDLEPMGPMESHFIQVISSIICHESFSNWIAPQHHILSVLKTCQVLIPVVDWDNYQLVGILAWLHPIFQRLTQKTINLNWKDISLQSENDEFKALHLELLIVLDCISELGKFNAAKDFMINYKLVEELVPLLGTLHREVKPRNMTKQVEEFTPSFPHIKSIIIEILSYLVYENFEVQEKIRDLEGLQVILSNCVIDDDNPFIKERAIICLKFLLQGNPKNQQLIAALEAKKVVDNDVLDEIGYEVNVRDGNIEMKKKP